MTETRRPGATGVMKSAVVPVLVGLSLLACGCSPGPSDEGGVADTGDTGEGTSGGTDTGMPPLDTGPWAESGDEGTSDTGASSTDTGGTSGTTGEPGTDSGDSGDSGGSGESGEDTDTTGGAAVCENEEWEASLATFLELAEADDDTYWYAQPTGGSGFAIECGYLTTVEVVQGTVVRRTHEITSVPEGWNEAMCTDDEWVEEEGEINSHDDPYAPPGLTMEQQYAGCCDLLALEPPEDYIFIFEVGKSGIADECLAFAANCADGCGQDVDGFGGFSISQFAFGTLP